MSFDSFSKTTHRMQAWCAYNTYGKKPILYLDDERAGATQFFLRMGMTNLMPVNHKAQACASIASKTNVKALHNDIVAMVREATSVGEGGEKKYSVVWLDLMCRTITKELVRKAVLLADCVFVTMALRGSSFDAVTSQIKNACAGGHGSLVSCQQYKGKAKIRNMAFYVLFPFNACSFSAALGGEGGGPGGEAEEERKTEKKAAPSIRKSAKAAKEERKKKEKKKKQTMANETRTSASSLVGKYVIIRREDFPHKQFCHAEGVAYYLHSTYYKTRLTVKKVLHHGKVAKKCEYWTLDPDDALRLHTVVDEVDASSPVVGGRVSVYFASDGHWYDGTIHDLFPVVHSARTTRRVATVVFDDNGKAQDIDLEAVPHKLL